MDFFSVMNSTSQRRLGLLLRQLDIAWALMSHHLMDLSSKECHWRPAPCGPHVQLTPAGVWVADWPSHEGYSLGPPSIAWTTWHVMFWWSMTMDHSFGPSTLDRAEVAWPGNAEAACAEIRRLHTMWREKVEGLSENDLTSSERTKWPIENRPFADVVAWVNIELTKNAAEIGFARFLYATTNNGAGQPADRVGPN
ncbi:DinB family protein [Piscinibacter gummiphilus]|uniref:DinB family protein n=1 Tax=Piscinibacter gummiphilus TaxID=946333 RepID=A0ABZ0CZ39_9BURK|nr:DinB family protein [Piscinibacter gummiphilus]WOB10217.1 DinB family protein [Piscinibacter gummiphilus]